MRRALLIAVVALGATAGTAYAAGYPYTDSTDVYTLTSSITPFKSGTVAAPQPADAAFAYDVDTAPSGSRPGLSQHFKTVFEGMSENSTLFPACSTTQLVNSGPATCKQGSKVGSGFIVLQEGPSDATTTAYDTYCSVDTTLYNGGRHNLSLYIVEGQGQGDYDPCVLPYHAPVVLNVNLVTGKLGSAPELGLFYSLPTFVLHPAPDTDASIIHQEWEIPIATTPVTTTTQVNYQVTVTKTRTVVKFVGHGKGRHKVRVRVSSKVVQTRTKQVTTTQRVGFLNTTYCPPDGQRQISANFGNEDGVSHTVNQTVACSA